MTKVAACLIVLVSSGMVACGGGGSRDIDEFVELDTRRSEAFAAAGNDCVAKAQSVREWRTKHNAAYTAVRDRLQQRYKDGPPKAALEKFGEQLKKNKQVVKDAMIACRGTPELAAAIEDTK